MLKVVSYSNMRCFIPGINIILLRDKDEDIIISVQIKYGFYIDDIKFC